MDKGKLAILGIFFIAFMATALLLTTLFKDSKGLWGAKDVIYIAFDSAEGLKEGDTVRVKGIEAGTITDMTFGDRNQDKTRNKIIVEVRLYEKDIEPFKRSYKITIEESSLIGGKYMLIAPRSSAKELEDVTYGLPLWGSEADPRGKPDSKEEGGSVAFPLQGVNEASGFKAINQWLKDNGNKFGEAFEKLKQLLDDIQKGSVGKVLTDEGKLYDDVKAAANNAASTFEDAKKVMEKVRSGEGSVGKLVFEDKLYNELTGLTEKARSIADRMDRGEGTLGKLSTDSKLYDDLADVMNAAKDLLNKMRTGEGTIGALLNERDLYDEMRDTTASLRDITRKISEGQGMAGRIVNDEELGSDFKDAVREFKESMKNMNSITDKLDKGQGTAGRLLSDDSLYNKADKAVDSLNKTLGSLASLRTLLGVEYRTFYETKVSEAMVYMDVYPAENKFLHLGGMSISVPEDSKNATESQQENDGNQNLLKIDAQLGYKFFDNRLTLRGGLLEGKPGGGIDYEWNLPYVHHDVRFTIEGRDAYNDVGDEDYDEKAGMIYNFEVSSRVWKYLRLEAGISRLGADAEFYTGFAFEWEDDDIRKFIGLISAAK